MRNTERENGLLFEDSTESCWCGALGGSVKVWSDCCWGGGGGCGVSDV